MLMYFLHYRIITILRSIDSRSKLSNDNVKVDKVNKLNVVVMAKDVTHNEMN